MRKGFALIVVLGVLALLSLLAVSFTTLAAAHRTVTRSWTDTARAKLIAQSGVEDAVARLRARAALGGFWDDSWRTFTASLESGTFKAGGDRYEVRVADAASQINVNDGVAYGPRHTVSLNLKRILNALGAQAAVGVPGLGDRLLAARPPGGFLHKLDLLRALEFDDKAWGRVRPFLTVHGWSDPNVANPVPLSAEVAGEYPVPFHRPAGIYRYGHGRNGRGARIDAPLLFFDPKRREPFHHAVWGRDSLHPQWIEIVSRSPVNVNGAPREVLIALLTDLEGFFLLERRRETPAGYAWADLRYTYDAGGESGEAGFLFRTHPIAGPRAEAVADEILACRGRRGKYGAAPFGGPFRSWAQFRSFADALVEEGVLADPRAGLFPDPHERRLASQAMADVLKANFDPNLHLNELNPDLALFTHVDKTDLLVNSTEFCFTPMGVFEIESEGRMEDAVRTAARSRVTAHVRLFDAERQTSQAHFYGGSIADRRGEVETNNNRSLETGPEPDNGPAPAENRAEGYVRLSTTGGNLFASGRHKPPGALWTTLADPKIYPSARPTAAPAHGHLGSSIHAHFQLDHAAHHHANRRGWRGFDGFRLPQGTRWTVWGNRASVAMNFEDRTEDRPPPCGPVDDTARYRLVRSFSPGEAIEPFEYAPSDLRLDGAYVERHSSFGYWIEENVSFNFNEGTAAFWLKPAFQPELTGKARTLLSAGRYHAHAAGSMNLSPFGLYFLPGSGAEGREPSYLGPFRPRSLAFGFGFSPDHGYGWELGGPNGAGGATVFTPPLNRKRGPSPLRAHEWIHVAATWHNPRGALPTEETLRILVNGSVVPGTRGMAHVYPPREGDGQPFEKTPRWTVHSLKVSLPGFDEPKWGANTIRLGGEPSMLFDRALGRDGFFPRNFSADATFDEFYLWQDRSAEPYGGLEGARHLWKRGRFYRPDDGDPHDAAFTSAPLRLERPSRNRTSPPRLLGVAWTAFGGAEVFVESGGAWYGPFRDDGWSAVRTPAGLSPEAAGEVRYRVKLKAGPEPVLLSSPVLDDVTLFFERPEIEFLGWVSG